MKRLAVIAACIGLLSVLHNCQPATEVDSANSPVAVKGAMRQVMWEGKLAGAVKLDTLAPGNTLFGLGPAEYLQGELMTIDGVTYRSFIAPDSTVEVVVSPAARPPFYVYQQIAEWQAVSLPDTVVDMPTLEAFLTQSFPNDMPYAFRLTGTIGEAAIHIQNLASGAVVRSPKEAHAGQVNIVLTDREADLLGFYSQHHQGIYTHHDTYMHIHLLTADTQLMGHVDACNWSAGALQLQVAQP